MIASTLLVFLILIISTGLSGCTDQSGKDKTATVTPTPVNLSASVDKPTAPPGNAPEVKVTETDDKITIEGQGWTSTQTSPAFHLSNRVYGIVMDYSLKNNNFQAYFNTNGSSMLPPVIFMRSGDSDYENSAFSDNMQRSRAGKIQADGYYSVSVLSAKPWTIVFYKPESDVLGQLSLPATIQGSGTMVTQPIMLPADDYKISYSYSGGTANRFTLTTISVPEGNIPHSGNLIADETGAVGGKDNSIWITKPGLYVFVVDSGARGDGSWVINVERKPV